MESFATVGDYREAYPDDENGIERIEAYLARVSRRIIAKLRKSGIDYENADEVYAGLLSDVTIDVAHRAIGNSGSESDVPFGATQMRHGAGDFTASYQMANPYGDIFLTKDELDALGIGAQRVAVLSCGEVVA